MLPFWRSQSWYREGQLHKPLQRRGVAGSSHERLNSEDEMWWNQEGFYPEERADLKNKEGGSKLGGNQVRLLQI